MSIRLFTPALLAEGSELSLPPGPARHAQVRRVQPGDTLWLFDGLGADWHATVLAMGKSEVRVRVGAPVAVARELPLAVTLALAMPANERMDTLVEKATELGVARIQPLHSERSVLRLSGERAARKQAHWQAIAEAACEQCGRARVPLVAPVLGLSACATTPPEALRGKQVDVGVEILGPALTQIRAGAFRALAVLTWTLGCACGSTCACCPARRWPASPGRENSMRN